MLESDSLPVVFLSLQNCRYSFGLGYGLSMTANAGLAPVVAKMQKRTNHRRHLLWQL